MKKIVFPLLILLLFMLTSCNILYVSNRVNIPLISQKSEMQVNFDVGLSGTELQAAFSPVNHLSLLVNLCYSNGDTTETSYLNIKFFEAAVGYYYPLKEKFVFEIYGGYGTGTFSSRQVVFDITNTAFASTSRVFLQPSFGFKSDYFDLAVGSRLSSANFIIFPGSTISYKGGNVLFFEPVIMTRLGYKHIFFNLQAGLSLANNEDFNIYYSPLIFNFGLTFKFGNLKPPAPRFSD